MTTPANAEIYRLSEMLDLEQRIMSIRDDGAAMRKYRATLRVYQRRRAGRVETMVRAERDSGYLTISEDGLGFNTLVDGKVVATLRPRVPVHVAWERSPYGGAHDVGLLADGGKYNRPVNSVRVDQYSDVMNAGRWRDLMSDPITITADGEVINGQHRIAAATRVLRCRANAEWMRIHREPAWSPDYDPAFLVLFNVPRDEIAFTDTAKRTGRDMTIVSQKLASVE